MKTGVWVGQGQKGLMWPLGRLAVKCGQSHLERVCGTESQDLAQVAIRRDAEALSV